jgi:hypothetical protein
MFDLSSVVVVEHRVRHAPRQSSQSSARSNTADRFSAQHREPIDN